LLGVVFVSGFALAWLVFGNMHMRSQLKIHRLKKQLNKQSKQVPADTKA
ncbi:lipopolysaccharide assembly protein LapA domain-containing protein, partial [Vibrio sp. 10N.222.54.A1]